MKNSTKQTFSNRIISGRSIVAQSEILTVTDRRGQKHQFRVSEIEAEDFKVWWEKLCQPLVLFGEYPNYVEKDYYTELTFDRKREII